ncbi:MAG TPA: hypothetical protein PK239_18325 [Chitinophagales bacterium]|nr:hypothetical protein [Chitinophagales bacterium]
MAVLLSAVSCSKEEAITPLAETTWASGSGKKVIYYAEWTDWGRTSLDCHGFGLCNFWDCWFCEVNMARRQAAVEFDDETRRGYFVIELDANKAEDISAIQNKETLYVDTDINNPNSVLHAGAYLYDPTVGVSGGYKIAITIK